MNEVYHRLATQAVQLLASKRASATPDGRPPRVLIALVGSPGSGKTTTAGAVTTLINSTLLPSRDPSVPSSVAIAMDGYHLTRAQLDAMPDPTEAHQRRGAPWTFDAAAIVELVRRCRDNSHDIKAPSFDHAVKDPVLDAIVIPAATQIIIFEGNYLLSKEAPWNEIAELVDGRWFLDVDAATARKRLIPRHVAAGIAPDAQAAAQRVDDNDQPNAAYIQEHLHRVDLTINSAEETVS